jgi:hypothetical protein
MTKQSISLTGRRTLAVATIALVFGWSSLSGIAATKPSAPAKAPSAPAHAAAAPASHPAGGAAGGAAHSSTTAGHTTTTTAGHTTTTTAGHTTTTTAGHTTTTSTASHTTAGGTAGAAHTTAGGTAGHSVAGGGAPKGTTASHSAISRPVPKGTTEHVTKTGSAVRTRPDGHVSDVHDARRGIDVHHGLDGSRHVSRELPGHGRMYAERGRPGYVQRGYGYHGHDFGRRSYYYHGREYDRYYRGYGYRGMYLNVYAPGYYYGPGFYGWAYNPWAAPISFAWGWGAAPWYGFYGGFFNPYPVYASAAFWLTDYIIAQDLQAAYAARQEAAVAAGEAIAAGGGPPALTPEAKQLIADEVKSQIALENAEAAQNAQKQDVDPGSSGIARLLADGKPHVFVVGGGLDLTDSTGAECAVSEGDALQLVSPPPSDATTADLVVLASKGGKECQRTATVAVNLTDLQEMQNHMRETIDLGLKDLQAKQGTGGIPAAPTSAQAPPTQTEYAAVAPPPDPKDAADLQAQAKDADQAEAEVTAAATTENGSPIGTVAPSGPPPSVALGQTVDQVKTILGPPLKTADLGAKQIYYYDGMKVIFKAGKVTDVE